MLTANPIEGATSFGSRVVLYALDDNPSEALVKSTFLKDYDLSSDELVNVLSLLNVKYIILHGDTDFNYIKDNPWWITTDSFDALQNSLNAQKDIVFLQKFGDLFIYLNSQWKPAHIFSATNFTILQGGLNQLIENSSFANTYPSSFYPFLSNQLGHNGTIFVSSDVPKSN